MAALCQREAELFAANNRHLNAEQKRFCHCYFFSITLASVKIENSQRIFYSFHCSRFTGKYWSRSYKTFLRSVTLR